MQIIIQKATGKALRRATETDARRAMLSLANEFGELEARPIAQTSFGAMEYDDPTPMTEVSDLERTYCSECGRGSIDRPAAELTVVREESRDSDVGSWRFFCPEHVPSGWGTGRRVPGRGLAAAPNEVLCPNCFRYGPVGPTCSSCDHVLSAD